MVQRTTTRKCNERRLSCKMRNWLQLMALGALAACSPKVAGPAPAPVVAGGWQAADPKGEEIQAAARHAADQLPSGHGTLAEDASAATQVVAGMNIRMVLKLADGSRWQTTVWHRLDGTYALTEVAPVP